MAVPYQVGARGRRSRLCGVAVGLGLAILAGEGLAAQRGASTLVVLVRHAERAPEPGDDPPISTAGHARAQALAAALVWTDITAVVTSVRRRTVQTAQPLMDARKLTAVTVPVDGGIEAQVLAVASAVRQNAGGAVLVVGHSNTVPAIIHALGGPRLPDICDASYATMFLLELPAASPPGAVAAAPRLVRAQYGAPDPPGTDACPGMVETPVGSRWAAGP